MATCLAPVPTAFCQDGEIGNSEAEKQQSQSVTIFAKLMPTLRALRIGYYYILPIDMAVADNDSSGRRHSCHPATVEELRKNAPVKYKEEIDRRTRRLMRILQARANRFQLVANEVASLENLDLVLAESDVHGGKDWLFANCPDVTLQMITGMLKHGIEFEHQIRELDLDR